ncbi:prenyltransferase/squalene oxidase repeat-containing protein [Actinomadura rifamycini]|uniref:prenyltransferase/squalene oxidase repeat-containing protein n=1 Tax=Actinomadura rifamycini TaxID=31962 RepID=UPI00040A7205|nr:prenyltransferase/squalene oxidase repeat-containing protein [Actinomadura rifamycini]
MSIDDHPLTDPALSAVGDPAVRPRLAAATEELIDGLVARPWGQASPSVYETGRLVTFVPWLSGHAERVRFLLETQRPDGAWGAPDDGYAIVPTLSATEALLSVLDAPDGARADGAAVAHAAARALAAVSARMCGPSAPALDLPDLPAVELIVPALVERINASLEGLRERPVPGLEVWAGYALPLPAGMDSAKLDLVRSLLASGADVPQKLVHALEIAGPAAAGLPSLSPEPTGTIGASPAATAAWLGHGPVEPSSPARWYLETVVAEHGGPVPCGFPLTVFERGWVLAWLARADVPFAVPPELVLSLTTPLGPLGTSAADGLPADADTTSGALYALALLGAPHPPDALHAYELDAHFCTWQGEDGASITTNAHVLEAFGQYLAARGDALDGADAARYAASARKAARWLRGQQAPDGSWLDRWHASPFYATACAAVALAGFGGPESGGAVAAARRWVLDAQREDGSWGHWEGTAEETAYAVQLLLLTGGIPDTGTLRAVGRACPLLLRSLAAPDDDAEPAMWHDKDLYRPAAIVRAAVISALALAGAATDFR